MSIESDGSGILLIKMSSFNNNEVIFNGVGIGNVFFFDVNGLGVILWDVVMRVFFILKFLDISEMFIFIGVV